MEIIVIGASGLLGSHIARHFRDEGHVVIGTYRSAPTAEASVHLDKTDEAAVSELISKQDPDAVIDTAAFHNVDQCETERVKAWSVNAIGTRHAAVAAANVDAHFVYFSTDYVFPGDPERAPYVESELIGPINYYGETKYAGEQASKIPDKWTILRSSVLYGASSPNFVTWVLDNLREKNEVKIVTDQVGTPTYADDVSEACLRVVSDDLTGLYHATGPESLSRYEFTKVVADAYGHSTECIVPVTSAELGQRADRPKDSSLDSSRLYEETGYTFRQPETAFDSMIK